MDCLMHFLNAQLENPTIEKQKALKHQHLPADMIPTAKDGNISRVCVGQVLVKVI